MRSFVALAARLTIAITFGYASLTKLADMHQFAEDVANYQILPSSLVGLAAASVVGIEILCAALLLIGVYVRPAAAAVALLLLVFTAGLSQALARDINLSCGCFGAVEPATWWTVLRDVVLLAIAVVPLWLGAGAVAFKRRDS